MNEPTCPLTVEQVEGAIANALHAGDIEAVRDFLTYLVALDPIRASEITETMKVALRMRGES